MGTAWKVVAAFVGVFIAGSVFGGFFSMRVAQSVQAPRRIQPPTPDFSPQLVKSYTRNLNLTTDQMTKLEPVLIKAEEEIKVIRKTEFDATFAVLQPLQVEIRKILTPEQLNRLEELERRQRDFGRGGPPNFNERGGRGGPPGSGRGNFENGGRGGRGGRGNGPGAPAGPVPVPSRPPASPGEPAPPN